MVAALVLAASLSCAQNAAQDRAASQAAQQTVDDAFEAQRRQSEAQWLAGRKQLLAADYFLSERLYWTTMLAVEKLPATQKLVDALSAARRALAGPWSPSAPTEAAQALAAAERLALSEGRTWIAKSAAEVKRGLPNAEQDWNALASQSRCYALIGPSSFVYAPGALAAIGIEKIAKGGETLTLSDLSMDGTTLKARAELKRGKTSVSSQDAAFPLDRPVSFGKITLTERTAGTDVCHLTRASAEALFDLPAD